MILNDTYCIAHSVWHGTHMHVQPLFLYSIKQSLVKNMALQTHYTLFYIKLIWTLNPQAIDIL